MKEIDVEISDDKSPPNEQLQAAENRKVMHCSCENCRNGDRHCFDFDWDAPIEIATTSGDGEATLVITEELDKQGGLP